MQNFDKGKELANLTNKMVTKLWSVPCTLAIAGVSWLVKVFGREKFNRSSILQKFVTWHHTHPGENFSHCTVKGSYV